MSFRWEIDLRRAVAAHIRKKEEAAIQDVLEHLLETANRTCPIEESTLIKSGDTSRQGRKGVVYYNTPYAARQHEETALRHNQGRRAKWLELTFKEERDKCMQRLAGEIEF